jgi:hypothetical protein
MTEVPLIEQGITALLDNFDRLETLFPGRVRVDEDLSLCFTCLRWTTGDEGCRRGYRCELQLALDQPSVSESARDTCPSGGN